MNNGLSFAEPCLPCAWSEETGRPLREANGRRERDGDGVRDRDRMKKRLGIPHVIENRLGCHKRQTRHGHVFASHHFGSLLLSVVLAMRVGRST